MCVEQAVRVAGVRCAVRPGQVAEDGQDRKRVMSATYSEEAAAPLLYMIPFAVRRSVYLCAGLEASASCCARISTSTQS